MSTLVWLPVFVVVAGAGVALLRRRRTADTGPTTAGGGSPVDDPASEALRMWLLAALDEHDDAVVVVDRIGREVVRNREARRRAEARTGELLAEPALAELLRLALEGRAAEDELRVFGPPRVILRLRARPIRHGDEVVGAVGYVRDVTESHRIDAVRRDFVANVSHELKTPIGALGVLAETIAASDDAETIRHLATRVDCEAERLGRLVDDLLDLGRAEAGDPTPREVRAIGVLVGEAVDAVGAAATAAGVPIVASIGDGETPRVECDPRQVHSALVNLLDNAIKYSEPGAIVEVGLAVDADERVGVVVRDHGIGIPSRSLERIFERFYRVDRARSRETGGTGLGLAIVRHVAQAHGGEVAVESVEGEGSTFVLWLPVSEGAP